jgi:HSP20 family protein
MMAIIRFTDPFFTDPFDSIRAFRNEMDRTFSRFFDVGRELPAASVFPQVNIYRDADKIYVTSELPGADQNDIDVSVQGNSLSIKGERKGEPGSKGARYHRKERLAGSFSRVITLPVAVDPHRVTAEYKNGILTLTMPVAEAAKPKRIEVKAD